MTGAPNINIRLAAPNDARAIAEIHVASWQAAYSNTMPASFLAGLSIEKRELAWRNALESDRLKLALACTNNEVVGWAGYGKCRDADRDGTWGEIEAIYLHPTRYGVGIGAVLMEHACQSLAAMGYTHASLWVLIKNWRARGFYEHAGFVADGQAKEFEIGGSVLSEMRYQRPLANLDIRF